MKSTNLQVLLSISDENCYLCGRIHILKFIDMEIITRKQYAQQLDSWIGKGLVIVLTGQRRIGKSYVLKDFIERHRQEAEANIIYIDKEKVTFKSITDNDALDCYVAEHFKDGMHNYILIDEVQDIKGWEYSVRSYRTEERTDVVITGSNSKMLSGELSTLLAGRYVELRIQGLSYAEFLRFHELPDSDETLWKYLTYGGLPGLRNIGINHEEMVWDYLSGVYNTIMLKDIVERHKIRNIPFLKNLLAFMADTIGKQNSASSITKYMKSQGEEISNNVVLNYSAYFAEAFLTCNVSRYDVHGKKLLESVGKTYFNDIGIRNFIVGGERDKDIEKLMENAVYQHLVRLGYHVNVGALRAGEIDFVCTRAASNSKPQLPAKTYVQVSYVIANEETHRREFGTLQNIPDSYPKYVISASPLLRSADSEGVAHLQLRNFLLNGFG